MTLAARFAPDHWSGEGSPRAAVAPSGARARRARRYSPMRFAKKMSGLPRPFASGMTPTMLKLRLR